MIEPRTDVQTASDGYALHGLIWQPAGAPRGRIVVLHGVQSHCGWYHDLGRSLAGAGYEAHFPDRRGSGTNEADRGHAPSAGRLVNDIAERLSGLRALGPRVPLVLAGISWGGKLAVITAAERPELVDGLALICPGLHPRVGVSLAERLRIAWAFFTNRRERFPIPLSDPALFTANPARQAYIAADPLSLRTATAGLLAVSTLIDRRVKKARGRVRQRALLMLAGQDRIVDNARTLAYFQGIGSPDARVIEYPEAHHTLEFEPDPSRYADDLLAWMNEAGAEEPSGPGRSS